MVVESAEIMGDKILTIPEIRRVIGDEEETGYDAPFAVFTWAKWLQMQVSMLNSFSLFQRAIDQHEPRTALLTVLEMQEITTELYKEACIWIVKQRESDI